MTHEADGVRTCSKMVQIGSPGSVSNTPVGVEESLSDTVHEGSYRAVPSAGK